MFSPVLGLHSALGIGLPEIQMLHCRLFAVPAPQDIGQTQLLWGYPEKKTLPILSANGVEGEGRDVHVWDTHAQVCVRGPDRG